MKPFHILRLGASVTALALLGCTESREPVGLRLAAEGTSSEATTYSGRATVAQAQILTLDPIRLGDTGPLPASGGAQDASLATVAVPRTLGVLELTAVVGHATTVGQGNHSRSEASLAELDMIVAGNRISAQFLHARAQATCEAGSATASGSSEIVGLVINGQAIEVTTEPNQTVDLPAGSGTVVINEQRSAVSGTSADIVVNALRVTVFGVADVIISSAHADISCGAPPPPPPPPPAVCPDFATGGGWITGTPSGAKGNFGVAGGIKNGTFWGHLSYNDHGTNGPKVKGTGVTGYERVQDDAEARRIQGTAEVNGVGGFTYEVLVADRGEPGRNDRFELRLSTGYAAAGSLGGGNLQLHENCP